MDGTLLNNEHVLSERTIAAIKKAQQAGIRFMIATGRSFEQAMTEEEARKTELFKFMIGKTKVVADFEELEALKTTWKSRM